MIRVEEKIDTHRFNGITRAFLKQTLRRWIGGEYPSTFRHTLKNIAIDLGLPVAESQAVFEPILAELAGEMQMKPVMEYTRRDGNPILDSVFILSHERVSCADERYVCCGKIWTHRNQRTYHNCRVQFEDGSEKWYSLFPIFTEGCPDCSANSKMKKTRKVRSGSYFVWKYGSRIVAIADSIMSRKFTLGQEVIAGGNFLIIPQGTKGYITRILDPVRKQGTDMLRVRFADSDDIGCKFKHLECDSAQSAERQQLALKQGLWL